MAKAINIEVTTFSAECPCGGGVIDKVTSSFQLDSDSFGNGMECHDCGVEIKVKNKTARF